MASTRILVVSPSKNTSGGAPISLQGILRYLRQDFDLTIVMPIESEFYKKIDGLPYVSVDMNWRNTLNIFRFIKKNQFELVYANGYHANCYSVLIAAKLLRVPFVWHIRETIQAKWKGRIIRFADILIGNSRSTCWHLRQHVKRKPIYFVPNGIALEDFSIDKLEARKQLRQRLGLPENAVIILNVGRICSAKNQLDAIKVFSLVWEAVPNPSILCLLGDVSEEAYLARLRSYIHEMNMESRVHILNHQFPVAPFFAGADLLLHTSLKESQGRVLLEAMASGLPVVAYRVGGVSDTVLHTKTGFLFAPQDIDDMVMSVKALLKNPSLRREIIDNSLVSVQQFTLRNSAAQLKNILQCALK